MACQSLDQVPVQHRPVRTERVQKMHIAFFGQLPLSKHVAHVAGDHRAFPTKQLSHLGLAQPDAVSLQAHIELYLATWGLEQDDMAQGVLLGLSGWCTGCHQTPTASSIFSASGIRISPEMSLGRRASRIVASV